MKETTPTKYIFQLNLAYHVFLGGGGEGEEFRGNIVTNTGTKQAA